MLKLAALLEAGGKRKEINRIALSKKLEHHIKNNAMLFRIKGIGRNNINDVMHPLGFQADTSEQCFLGFYVLRRNAKFGGSICHGGILAQAIFRQILLMG